MKPLRHPFAVALVLAAALNVFLLPAAHAAAPATSSVTGTTLRADTPQGFAQFLDNPFSSDLNGLSTPVKYGLLLVGLSLIEKLSRQPRGR
jgi:hypothetical protein